MAKSLPMPALVREDFCHMRLAFDQKSIKSGTCPIFLIQCKKISALDLSRKGDAICANSAWSMVKDGSGTSKPKTMDAGFVAPYVRRMQFI